MCPRNRNPASSSHAEGMSVDGCPDGTPVGCPDGRNVIGDEDLNTTVGKVVKKMSDTLGTPLESSEGE